MSVGFIDIEIIGQDDDVQRLLGRLDTALNPVAVAGFLGAKVAPWLYDRAEQRFQSEGDDVSGKWPALAAETVRIRQGMISRQMMSPGVGADHPINKRTGELENYILAGGHVGGATATAYGASLMFPEKTTSKRSVAEKMKTAQRGKARPNTPPRPVLGVNEKDLLYVLTALAFHVKGLP